MNGLRYTKITIFHVLWLFAVAAGAALGLLVGLRYFSTMGLIICGIIGLAVGHILGCLPDWICTRLFFRHLMKCSKDQLRAMVAAGDWKFDNTMALLRLGALGEDVRQEIPRIVAMLESDSQLTRIYGWDALRIVFTEQSWVIEDYNPRGSTEDCRSRTAILKAALVKGLPPAKPAASPSQKVMRSKKKRFSWLALLLFISFFAVAVTIGLLFVSATRKPTDSRLTLILVGALAGFYCAWLLYFSIAQFYLRVIRGGPFNVGDTVEITDGPHKGKKGPILIADKKQGVFKVDIGLQSDEWDDNYFHEFAIRKLRKVK
jgi:hypothetical protein